MELRIETALSAVGDLLESEGVSFSIVVAGGAALTLLGILERTTEDVDVLAVGGDPWGIQAFGPPPVPLAPFLTAAVERVARDFRLPPDWLNANVSRQWQTGLPAGVEDRLVWTRYGGLAVGLVSRRDLIFMKLFAAADQPGPASVHYQDLMALKASQEELEAAAAWTREQDPSPAFEESLRRLLEYHGRPQ